LPKFSFHAKINEDLKNKNKKMPEYIPQKSIEPIPIVQNFNPNKPTPSEIFTLPSAEYMKYDDLGDWMSQTQLQENSEIIVEQLKPTMEWFKTLTSNKKFIEFTKSIVIVKPVKYGPNFEHSKVEKVNLENSFIGFLQNNPELKPDNGILGSSQIAIQELSHRISTLMSYNAEKNRKQSIPHENIKTALSPTQASIQKLKASFPTALASPRFK
jgi:hypothetical protein